MNPILNDWIVLHFDMSSLLKLHYLVIAQTNYLCFSSELMLKRGTLFPCYYTSVVLL